MTDWTTHEDGSRTFNHEGWTVQVFPPDFYTRFAVRSPHYPAEDVQVDPDGLWVNGENDVTGWEYASPRAFTIPWPVVVAIIEARAIVTG